MSTLAKRVVTAAVLLAVLGYTLFYLPAFASVLLIGLFLLMGSWEWSGFFAARNVSTRLGYVLVLLLLAFGAWFLLRAGNAADSMLVIAVVCWSVMAGWLIIRQAISSSVGCALFGVIALLSAWYAVLRLFAMSDGAALLVWVVGIVAAADIGAYFTGRSFGRRKLAPLISPGKTREGLVGGLLCGSIAGSVGAWLLGFAPLAFFVAGALIALISVVGDLTVSVFKRNAGLKDSGWILPGHGGVMDRIDSLIAALPLFVLILQNSGQGVTIELVAG
ncbi:MAG: phosphatidate cytidylyltransferase [Gammaproteobacteria bacterium]